MKALFLIVFAALLVSVTGCSNDISPTPTEVIYPDKQDIHQIQTSNGIELHGCTPSLGGRQSNIWIENTKNLNNFQSNYNSVRIHTVLMAYATDEDGFPIYSERLMSVDILEPKEKLLIPVLYKNHTFRIYGMEGILIGLLNGECPPVVV